MIISKAIIYSM